MTEKGLCKQANVAENETHAGERGKPEQSWMEAEMNSKREMTTGLMGAAVLLALGCGMGWTQSTSSARQPGVPPYQTSSRPGNADPMNDSRIPGMGPSVAEKMAIARNDERQKRLQSDTAQLLALATKLKEDVDKTDKYTLSLDVLKRTAEIEKLAKSIRERMKE